MQGYLSLLLHTHLPFVRHPEHERFLEENWLHEAITETYLPLIQIMDGWLENLSKGFIGYKHNRWWFGYFRFRAS